MKDSPFLSNVLSEAALSGFEALAVAPDATFQEQVKLAGLVPAKDFQNADLRNIDLTDSNLSGFNFSGADLRGSTGIRVKWDDTTIFDSADLSGSIFAAKIRLRTLFDTDERANSLLASVARQSWSAQIIWAADNLRSSGRFNEFALPITEALFYRAYDDEFLQAELMRYLAPRMGSRETLYDMLTAAISDEPKAAVVIRSVFSILRQHHFTNDSHIRQQALALIKSQNPAIQEEAVRFLMRSRPSAEEIRTVRSAAEAGGKFLAGVYVAEISHRLGQTYELVTREPVSNASFSIVATLTPSDLNLIARRWLRAESSRNAKDLNLPLVQRKGGANYFSPEEIEKRALNVEELWSHLKRFGIEIGVEENVAATVPAMMAS
ncbi:pentapeptide repeat-containing protein [Mesorhizobium sp. M0938]|uniref:pentapeptide repeat-containing protein n=1 Tax=unclassified Mesorhizobium TaxID=325217 RepID=UPI0033392FC7